jgi:hypothetical protein
MGSFSVCAGGMGRRIWYFGSQTEAASERGGAVETAGVRDDALTVCATDGEAEQAVTSKRTAAVASTGIRI